MANAESIPKCGTARGCPSAECTAGPGAERSEKRGTGASFNLGFRIAPLDPARGPKPVEGDFGFDPTREQIMRRVVDGVDTDDGPWNHGLRTTDHGTPGEPERGRTGETGKRGDTDHWRRLCSRASILPCRTLTWCFRSSSPRSSSSRFAFSSTNRASIRRSPSRIAWYSCSSRSRRR